MVRFDPLVPRRDPEPGVRVMCELVVVRLVWIVCERGRVVDAVLKRPLLVHLAIVQPVDIPGREPPAHVRSIFLRARLDDPPGWLSRVSIRGENPVTRKLARDTGVPGVGHVREVRLDEFEPLPDGHLRLGDPILVIHAPDSDRKRTDRRMKPRRFGRVGRPIPRMRNRRPLVPIVGQRLGRGVGAHRHDRAADRDASNSCPCSVLHRGSPYPSQPHPRGWAVFTLPSGRVS